MSIELDWELSDAPQDQTPPPIPQAPLPRQPKPSTRPAGRRPARRWAGPLLTLILLAGLGSLAAWQVSRLGWQRVTGDITALVHYEDAQAANGAADLVLNVSDNTNPDWVAARRAQLAASLSAPLPLPLVKPATSESGVGSITSLDADHIVAEIHRTYVTASGERLEFILPQVYRRDEDGEWEHTAPPGHFWGAWTDWHSDVLHIRHSERDRAIVDAIAPRLEAWLRALCDGWSVPCSPAKLYLSGYVGSLDYGPLENIEVRVEFGEGEDALPPDYFLSLPSPQIAGIPAGRAAQDLLAEYLAIRLIASLASKAAATEAAAATLTAQAIEDLGLGRADPGYAALAEKFAEVFAAQAAAEPDAQIVARLQDAVEADRQASYPTRAIWREYVIQPGDTLLGIANQFRVSVDDIVRWNEIEDLDFIVAGAKLVIPVATSLETLPSP